MAEDSSNKKKSSNRVRAKWWLTQSNGKHYVSTKNGLLKSPEGVRFQHVVTIGLTKKKEGESQSVKITFANHNKGLPLPLTLFDFSASEVSKLFKEYTASATQFVSRFQEVARPSTATLSDNLSRSERAESQPIVGDTDTTAVGENIPEPVETPPNRPSRNTCGARRKLNVGCPMVESPNVSPPKPKRSRQDGIAEKSNESFSTTLTSENFLVKMKEYEVSGIHRVLTSSLSPPREEYRLREVNALHKAALKQGLLEVPLAYSKPLIVVAKGLLDATQIKTSRDLEKFELEVLGGNHRRDALMDILEDEEKGQMDCYKYVYAQVYAEIPHVDALRLAGLHNRVDTLHHEINTKEKVTICRNLLNSFFEGKKNQPWKEATSAVIGESVAKLEFVYFLSGLKEDEYSLLIKALDLYSKMELKGQKVSVSNLHKRVADCPPYRFKCLRGELQTKEIHDLLKALTTKEITLREMETEARRIKEMRDVKRVFMGETGCTTWEEASERFSDWVSEETLQRFQGQARTSTMKDFIVRALEWESTKTTPTQGAALELRNDIEFKQNSGEVVRARVINDDAMKCISNTFLNKMSDYNGASVVFMDIPKDMDADRLSGILRIIRASNCRKSVGGFHVILFGTQESLAVGQSSARQELYTVESAYYAYTDVQTQEQSKLSSVVYHFLVAHSTDHGWKVNSTNLFQVAKPKATVEETTGTHYSREKPVLLYNNLIKLFAKPKTWVMDVFSGCGSAACASVGTGFNCMIIEKSKNKTRLIRRRLNQLQCSQS